MTVGERIKLARESRGMTRPQLAKKSGVPYPTLAGLENADQAGSTQLPALAKALKVRPYWLQTGDGPMEESEPDSADGSDWPDVTGYAQAVGLGDGAEAAEYEEAHKLKFRAESLARKGLRAANLAVVYGKGDSMLPRIHPGDAILFDKSDTRPSDGDLFVICMEGAAAPEYNVKRCEIIDEDVFFRADNPAGDHNWRRAKNMHNKRNPIKIIGRVRWIGSWED